MIEPVVIEPTVQKASSDCAVACLAMLLGVPYATVLDATSKRAKVKNTGMSRRQILNVARKIDMPLWFTERNPEDDEFGMIELENDRREQHVALHLKGSNVLDPADGYIYTDVAAFLLAKGWDITGFYYRREV